MTTEDHGGELEFVPDPEFEFDASDSVVGLRHLRIKASAGTGKTFRLAGRFLDLVDRGVDPKTILATTFTRAAAGEIRDRVFCDAARLVLEKSGRDKAIRDRNFARSSMTDADATRLLERLIDDLPALQIRTLDSVFASIAAGLGPGSGVPHAARLVEADESAELLRRAIDHAIDESDEEAMLATLETLGRKGTKVTIVPVVERAVAKLLTLHEESAVDAWTWPAPERDEEAIAAIRDRLLDESFLTPFGKRIGGELRKLGLRTDAVLQHDGAGWIEIGGASLVKIAVSGGTYYKKELPPPVAEILTQLGHHAEAGNLRNLSKRTACIRDLLVRIGPWRAAIKRRRRLAEFDDFARALDPVRGGVGAGELEELWYRIDARIEHLLLDEFQDTSATQWRAMRPIAGEIASVADGSRSLFVVGDVKQSIYGWRGGDPRILEQLESITSDGQIEFVEETLERSYRSSPAVIELVNAVFEGVAGNAAIQVHSSAAARSFGDLFRTHETELKDLPGSAVVERLPLPDEDEDKGEVLARCAAEAAARLVDRHGLEEPDGRPTVAVLVRGNKRIGPIVEALRAMKIPATGRGGGSLLDAEASVVMIQAMRLAGDVRDSLAADDVARSPLGALLNVAPPAAHRRLDATARGHLASLLRHRFAESGVAPVIDDWRRRLEPMLTAREAVRLRQLVESVESLEADPSVPRGPGELARLVRTIAVEDPGGDGVVVMNIHQSKGLEFRGLVVTDLAGKLCHQPDIASGTPVRPTLPVPQVSSWYSEKARPAGVEQVHQETTDRAVLESVCGLYVALTRAAQDLVVQVPAPSLKTGGEETKTSLGSAAGIVRDALQIEGPADDENDVAEVSAVEVWRAKASNAKIVTEEKSSATADRGIADRPSIEVVDRTRRRRAVSMRPPSSRKEDRGRLFELRDPGAADRGTAIHACFEAIEWATDLARISDDVLDDCIRRVVPGRPPEWRAECIKTFRTACSQPSVFDLLSGPQPGQVVRRERRFVISGPEGVQQGSIDRLILETEPGPGGEASRRVVGARIIDFKTGRVDSGSEDPSEVLLERHRLQLEGYRAAIARSYAIESSAISAAIVAVDAGLVVELPIDGAG
jgi:ATP-dependent exoDNAse (exonuclease V) beta subunit